MEKKSLTHREVELLALVARGKSNKEIAKIFNLSVFTVQTHLANINRKLNVSNRTEAANFYWENNIQKILETKDGNLDHFGYSRDVDLPSSSSEEEVKVRPSIIKFSFLFVLVLIGIGLSVGISAVRASKDSYPYLTITVNGETKRLTVGDVVTRGTRNADGYCEFPEIEENGNYPGSIGYASTENIVEENCDLVISSIVLQQESLTPEAVDPNGSMATPVNQPAGND